RGPVFAGAALFAAAFVGFGGFVHLSNGLPQRFAGEAHEIGEAERDISPYRDQCANNLPASFSNYCVFGAHRQRVVAIVGDSHSTEIFWKTAEHLGDRPFSVQEFTWNACPPYAGLTRGIEEGCRPFLTSEKNYILQHAEIDTVVIISNYPDYLNCPQKRH